MGGSSSKTKFSWKKKKKSPLNKAWSDLKGALPEKKRKKSSLSLDRLNLDNLRKGKSSQRRFSLPTDKKEPTRRFSLGNMRKTPAKKEKERKGGGLGRVGEQIKRTFSREQKKEVRTHQDASPAVKLKTKERKEANPQRSGTKPFKINFRFSPDPFI